MEQNPFISVPTSSAPARMTEIRFDDNVRPPLLAVPENDEGENDQKPRPTQNVWPTGIKGTDQMSVTATTFRTARSRASSLWTRSTGKLSQKGAIWRFDFSTTLNSGFGNGGRSAGFKGVREGRERGGFLPDETGVGRTGKGPAAVPEAMIKALRQGTGIDQRKRKEITRKMDDELRKRLAGVHAPSIETDEEIEAGQQLRVLHDGLWLIQGIIGLCERAGSSEIEVVRHLKEIQERFHGVLMDMGIPHDQTYQGQPERIITNVSGNRDLLKKIIEQVDFCERRFGIIVSILTDAWVLRQKIPGARDGPFKLGPPPVEDEDAYRDWNYGEGGPVEHGRVFTPSQEQTDLYLEEEKTHSIKIVSYRVLVRALDGAEHNLDFLEKLVDLRDHRPSDFAYQVLLSAGAIQPEVRDGWLLFWVVTSKAWRSAPALKALGHGATKASYAERLQNLENKWAQIVAKYPSAKFSHQGRDVERMHQRAMYHAGLSNSTSYRNIMEVRQEDPHKGVECWFLEDVKTGRRKVIV